MRRRQQIRYQIMSGVEIAGLVLGAIPIVFAALENYEKALDPMKAFARWRGDLDKLIMDLWYPCRTTKHLFCW